MIIEISIFLYMEFICKEAIKVTLTFSGGGRGHCGGILHHRCGFREIHIVGLTRHIVRAVVRDATVRGATVRHHLSRHQTKTQTQQQFKHRHCGQDNLRDCLRRRENQELNPVEGERG